MLNTHSQKVGHDAAMVGSEGKIPLPTKIRHVVTINATRFSWISSEISTVIH